MVSVAASQRSRMARYYTATVELRIDSINDVEPVDLEVKYVYDKGFPQTLDSPAEPSSIEVVGVFYRNRDIRQLLSPYDYELIEDELLEWHEV